MSYPEQFEKWYARYSGLSKKSEAFEKWVDITTRTSNTKKKKAKKKPKRRKNNKKFKHLSPEYVEYMQSKAWKEKSNAWRKEAGCCEVCGGTKKLQCHHKHYQTFKNERREDIMVVCTQCHANIHALQKAAKNKIHDPT